MKEGIVSAIDNLLLGHTVHVLLGFCTVALVAATRTAYKAWRDVTRLDVEQRGLASRMLQPVMERVRPRDEIAIRALRVELVQAGLRGENAIERFTFFRASGLIVAAALTFVMAVGGAAPSRVLVLGILFFSTAYLAPDVYVSRRKADRQAKMNKALPPMIDLMVLCLEVGLSVESAFERVALEMRSMEPLMAEEATLMVSEMGAGLTFPQALHRLADRVGIDDLTVLSRLISQASSLGASVTKALREYSDASFQKRVLNLEEKAGKLSSTMVLPITACFLPAVMIALVGPAGIALAKTFGGGN